MMKWMKWVVLALSLSVLLLGCHADSAPDQISAKDKKSIFFVFGSQVSKIDRTSINSVLTHMIQNQATTYRVGDNLTPNDLDKINQDLSTHPYTAIVALGDEWEDTWRKLAIRNGQGRFLLLAENGPRTKVTPTNLQIYQVDPSFLVPNTPPLVSLPNGTTDVNPAPTLPLPKPTIFWNRSLQRIIQEVGQVDSWSGGIKYYPKNEVILNND